MYPSGPPANRSTDQPRIGLTANRYPQPLANSVRAGRDQRPAGPCLSASPASPSIQSSTQHSVLDPALDSNIDPILDSTIDPIIDSSLDPPLDPIIDSALDSALCTRFSTLICPPANSALARPYFFLNLTPGMLSRSLTNVR
jgi:hypothetical protein